MISSVVVGLALVLGAPGTKEPPKKDVSIVGEWILEKMLIGEIDVSPPKDKESRFVFSNDGKLNITETGQKPETDEYKLDLKKNPAQIDILPAADSKDASLIGIFKIDGDVLTICCAEGTKNTRPTKFESTKETKAMLMTFKRVKK
jgi:uncharacterized protein (TIGR03067 family)